MTSAQTRIHTPRILLRCGIPSHLTQPESSHLADNAPFILKKDMTVLHGGEFVQTV